MKDLFKDYKNQPTELSNILTKFEEEHDEISYHDLKRLRIEVETIGFTFDYGLDAEVFGLRPLGINLNQLEAWEDDDFEDLEGDVNPESNINLIYKEATERFSDTLNKLK